MTNGSTAQLDRLAKAYPYLLTSRQWHPTLRYTDPCFGSAEKFAEQWRAEQRSEPTAFVASAAITVHTLSLALATAVAQCDFSAALPPGGPAGAASPPPNAPQFPSWPTANFFSNPPPPRM